MIINILDISEVSVTWTDWVLHNGVCPVFHAVLCLSPPLLPLYLSIFLQVSRLQTFMLQRFPLTKPVSIISTCLCRCLIYLTLSYALLFIYLLCLLCLICWHFYDRNRLVFVRFYDYLFSLSLSLYSLCPRRLSAGWILLAILVLLTVSPY